MPTSKQRSGKFGRTGRAPCLTAWRPRLRRRASLFLGGTNQLLREHFRIGRRSGLGLRLLTRNDVEPGDAVVFVGSRRRARSPCPSALTLRGPARGHRPCRARSPARRPAHPCRVRRSAPQQDPQRAKQVAAQVEIGGSKRVCLLDQPLDPDLARDALGEVAHLAIPARRHSARQERAQRAPTGGAIDMSLSLRMTISGACIGARIIRSPRRPCPRSSRRHRQRRSTCVVGIEQFACDSRASAADQSTTCVASRTGRYSLPSRSREAGKAVRLAQRPDAVAAPVRILCG